MEKISSPTTYASKSPSIEDKRPTSVRKSPLIHILLSVADDRDSEHVISVLISLADTGNLDIYGYTVMLH